MCGQSAQRAGGVLPDDRDPTLTSRGLRASCQWVAGLGRRFRSLDLLIVVNKPALAGPSESVPAVEMTRRSSKQAVDFFVLCRRGHRTNYADRFTMRISRWPYAWKRRRGWSRRRQNTQRSRLWRGGQTPARLRATRASRKPTPVLSRRAAATAMAPNDARPRADESLSCTRRLTSADADDRCRRLRRMRAVDVLPELATPRGFEGSRTARFVPSLGGDRSRQSSGRKRLALLTMKPLSWLRASYMQ